MKRVLILLIATYSIFLYGCGAYIAPIFKDPGNTPVSNYKFNYSVVDAKKLKTPLTFLLISPTYNVNFPNIWLQGVIGSKGVDDLRRVITNFSNALENDYNKLMVERGFRLISLLKDQAMATYSQREQSTFALKSRIEIDVNATENSKTEPKEKLGSGLIGAKEYDYGIVKGEFNVKYKIYLEVYEPFTWQLIWVKTIEEQDPNAISYTYNWNYTDKNFMEIKIGSDSRQQSLADLLMDVHKNTLSKCEVFIDPEEFTILSRNADEIRKKAQGVIK